MRHAAAIFALALVLTTGNVAIGQSPARVTRLPQASTFFGVPSAELNSLKADVVFLGVPYDLGHNSLPGARLGPAAIREASSIAGPPGADGFYDRETGESFMKGVRVVDAGDVIAPTANVGQSLDNVTSAVAAIVSHSAMPVTIGGDHSITFAVLRGFEAAGKKLHVIHLDSHQDFGPIADRGTGQPVIQHGNHLRHAMQLRWIGGMTMLGLRGLAHGAGATASEVRTSNVTMISASQAIKMGPAAVASRIANADAYYVTIDIDVLDPSIAPATGTPVPGGFSYYQMCELLDAIASKGPIAGFDITEVSPPYDHNNETSLLASYLGLRFLESIYSHRDATNKPK
ncbi:MAG TPA: arginase family protein [Vicinamibacterales bacterium]|nr:arginase family protein [Vicinamibacterales bacterium]